MLICKLKSNIQITPTRNLTVTNDRLTKKLFNLTGGDIHDWIDQQLTVRFLELKGNKRRGDIFSPIKLSVKDNFSSIPEPIDQFDLAVLTVCISEWLAGNRHITPSIIYRALTGKVGKSAASPSKNQLAAILNSLNVLMRLQIDYDMTDCCRLLGYNGGKPAHLISSLLPASCLNNSTVNGNVATIFHFDRESPLLLSAQIKNNQLITFDCSLLNVPHQQNTRMNIALKFYVLKRVLEIKLHNLTSTLTFPDVFDKCNLSNAGRKKQFDARQTILTFFEHLQRKGVIKSFLLTKEGKSFHSIKFDYSADVAERVENFLLPN